MYFCNNMCSTYGLPQKNPWQFLHLISITKFTDLHLLIIVHTYTYGKVHRFVLIGSGQLFSSLSKNDIHWKRNKYVGHVTIYLYKVF